MTVATAFACGNRVSMAVVGPGLRHAGLADPNQPLWRVQNLRRLLSPDPPKGMRWGWRSEV